MPSKNNTTNKTKQDLTKLSKKSVKKPVVIIPKNQKTLPSRNYTPKEVTVDTSKLSKNKEFIALLEDAIAGIEIPLDDLDDEMLAAWEDFDDEIRPKLLKKNWAIWAAIFSPVILPGLVKGMRSEPTVPQPKVIIKGRQQEVTPPTEPRKIVDYASEYFKNHGLELCKSLTETDLARLKDDLRNNWGKGPDAFAEAFKESYPVSKSRLETIYRSERHMAEYYGVQKRAEDAGHSYKQYRAVGDERSCDLCMSFDMEIKPIDEPFSNGNMGPSSHPNCRCSMITLTDDEYNEMPDEQIYQDASYLNEVTNFMKLNYKCEWNGNDNKCNLESKFSDKIPDKLQSILNKSEEQKMALSNREQTAINNYKHFNYSEINGYLRDNDTYLSKDSKEDIDQLDNAFTKISMPEDIIVYSGLKRVPGNVVFKPGNIFSVPEYTSSSVIPQSSYGFARSGFMLEIEVPKGSKALYVGSALRTNEKEVLINHGSTYEVIGLPEVKTIHNEFGDDNVKVVRVRLVSKYMNQDASYLNEVAEQLKLNYKCPKDSHGEGFGCGEEDLLDNFRLEPKKLSIEDRQKRDNIRKNPLRFVEYNINLNNKTLVSSIKNVINTTIKNIPEAHGISLTIKSSPHEEFKWQSGQDDKYSTYASHDTGTIYINEELFNNDNELKRRLTKDEKSRFHPKGCNTPESIIYHELGHWIFDRMDEIADEKLDKIDEVIKQAYDNGNLSKLSRYSEINMKDGNISEARAEAFSSIFSTPEKDQQPIVKSMKQILFNNNKKQDASYLNDVASFIKQNLKCKVGTYDDTNACGPQENAIDKQNTFNTQDTKPVETFETIAGLSHIKMWTGIPPIVRSNAPELSKEETNLLYKYFGKEKYSHAINKASYDPTSSNKSVIEKGNKIESIINRSTLPIDIVSFSGASDKEINELLSKKTISSFVSTSMDKNITYRFGKNVIEFRLPKGTNALIPGYALNQFSENEVLLNRNIKFDIVSDTIEDRPIEHHYIIVTPSLNTESKFQEVSSSFNTELGGFHTTDYKTTNDKQVRVISQDKADNPKLLEAIKDLDVTTLPSQFMVMKMKAGTPAKYYTKTDSIGVDKSLSSSEMATEIKKVLDSMKTNSGYLEEVSDFLQNRNSSYLQEAADYLILQDAAETTASMSLNRQGKCPRGTVDDSFKCGNEEPSKEKDQKFIGLNNIKDKIKNSGGIDNFISNAKIPELKSGQRPPAIAWQIKEELKDFGMKDIKDAYQIETVKTIGNLRIQSIKHKQLEEFTKDSCSNIIITSNTSNKIYGYVLGYKGVSGYKGGVSAVLAEELRGHGGIGKVALVEFFNLNPEKITETGGLTPAGKKAYVKMLELILTGNTEHVFTNEEINKINDSVIKVET